MAALCRESGARIDSIAADVVLIVEVDIVSAAGTLVFAVVVIWWARMVLKESLAGLKR